MKSYAPDSDPRRLYADIQPVHDGVCDVCCSCGWSVRVPTQVAAQRLAWAHDAQHWAGRVVVPRQTRVF